MEYTIREMREDEDPLRKEFLYDAGFVPEGEEPPDRSITDSPELQVYIRDFGSSRHDHALAAVADGSIAGAVWIRIMDDYGHVDDETPSCAVSLSKEYRGQGMGSQLMMKMLALLRQKGYKKVSLSVQKANDAVKMYAKAGFKTVDANEEEYSMTAEL